MSNYANCARRMSCLRQNVHLTAHRNLTVSYAMARWVQKTDRYQVSASMCQTACVANLTRQQVIVLVFNQLLLASN